MHYKERLKELLARHGHSARRAAGLAQLSQSTMERLLNGEIDDDNPRLREYINKIAAGYAVRPEDLLGDQEASGDFDWLVKQASESDRLRYLIMTSQERLHMLVAFLKRRHPAQMEPARLAAAAGIPTRAVQEILHGRHQVDRPTVEALVSGLDRLLGIHSCFVLTGCLRGESGLSACSEAVYAASARQKAVQPGAAHATCAEFLKTCS